MKNEKFVGRKFLSELSIRRNDRRSFQLITKKFSRFEISRSVRNSAEPSTIEKYSSNARSSMAKTRINLFYSIRQEDFDRFHFCRIFLISLCLVILVKYFSSHLFCRASILLSVSINLLEENENFIWLKQLRSVWRPRTIKVPQRLTAHLRLKKIFCRFRGIFSVNEPFQFRSRTNSFSVTMLRNNNSPGLMPHVYLKNTLLVWALVVFTFGLIGNLLNILILLTEKQFRKTLNQFYFIISSIFSIGFLIESILIKHIFPYFNIDFVSTQWECKLHMFFNQLFTLVPLGAMCFAAFSLCVNMRHYHLNSYQLASRQMAIVCSLVFFHCWSFFFAYHVVSNRCVSIINGFSFYFQYFYKPIISGLVPLSTMLISVFVKTFLIQTQRTRQNRLNHDFHQQLNRLTLIQVIISIISLFPYVVYSFYLLPSIKTENTLFTLIDLPDQFVQLLFSTSYIVSFPRFWNQSKLFHFWITFSIQTQFYVSFLVSQRFRKQFIRLIIRFVRFLFCLGQTRPRRNQISPKIEIIELSSFSRHQRLFLNVPRNLNQPSSNLTSAIENE